MARPMTAVRAVGYTSSESKKGYKVIWQSAPFAVNTTTFNTINSAEKQFESLFYMLKILL